MKPKTLGAETHLLLAAGLLACAGCSTVHQAPKTEGTETVMVTYHVKKGSEADFQRLLSQAWSVYRNGHLVFAQPHVIVRDAEDGDKTRFIEIFTWVKAPEHPSDAVKAVWEQEQSMCEARDGHRGIEGGEVALISK